jgi:Asp-tRNA(Asn)/Glu-tRNA(Gln) amidotransferase C subunit
MAISFSKQMLVEAVKQILVEHETDPNLELTVGDYQTKHYHMCPGAKTLYQDIESKVEDIDLAVRAAKLQDALFAMEEMALERGATEADVFAAEAVANQIMSMAQMMGLEQEHSYIQGHVDKIKGAVENVDEANKDIIINNPQDDSQEARKDQTIPSQLRTKVADTIKRSQKGDVVTVPTMKEMISVGHIDDEPGMLKQFAFDTAQYAAKLYKLLHHYEQMEDHVDFPNWWQHKVMMAREYMSKATHYLEFETMKPQIDAAVDGHSEEPDEELNELFGRAKNKIVNYKGVDYEILDIDNAGTFTLIDPNDKSAKPFYVNKKQMKAGRVPDVKEPEVEEVPLMNLREDDVEAPATGFEDDSAKAPKGDKKLNKAASKDDKIIYAFQKIQPLFKKAAAGDKEALAIVKANQDVIKAYKKMKQKHLTESKATCCGKCGRTHVKGTECKKPFLTGKDHCRVR